MKYRSEVLYFKFIEEPPTQTIYEAVGSVYPFTETCPECKAEHAIASNSTTCKECGWTDPCIWEKCNCCGAFIRHLPGTNCQLCGGENA